MMFLKPWYVFRPRQIFVRAWRSITPRPRPGARSMPLPWGCSVTVDPTKALGECLWKTGAFDIAVSEVLARLIQQGDLVLDVGANIGYLSILMGLCAGTSGELMSFEPHPVLFQSLKNNLNEVQRNACFAKLALHNTAVSNRAGEARLFIPPEFEGNEGTARLDHGEIPDSSYLPVKTETLDAVLKSRRVSVMKLDVEGAELEVLEGAAETLRQGGIRHLVYEDHEGVSSPVSSYLRGHGYAIHQIGFTLSRPVLAAAEAPPIRSPYMAPSYLATLESEVAIRQCRARGWRVLGSLVS